MPNVGKLQQQKGNPKQTCLASSNRFPGGENTPIQIRDHWIEGKWCRVKPILFPNCPAAVGRKAAGNTGHQDQNP